MAIDAQLPPFPSTQSRSSLPAGQAIQLLQKISSSLSAALSLPPSKRDGPASQKFVATYAKDAAFQVLKSIIWGNELNKSNEEKQIHRQTLLLAEKLASTMGFAMETLIDLAIVYAKTSITRVRAIFQEAIQFQPSLVQTIEAEVVPAFISLLSPNHSQGLYGLRKTAYCICSLLNACPPDAIRPFSQNQVFVVALAAAYDSQLNTIATSYGGVSVLARAEGRELDEWERIWLECKVALVDSFHIIITSHVKSLSTSAPGTPALAHASEAAFNIIFALLELPSSSSVDVSPTPFLNQSLLADYQHSYDISQTLASALNHVPEKDVRLDVLEASLASFENNIEKDNPGVLKLLIRTSGAPPGKSAPTTTSIAKGKSKAPPPDPELEAKVAQVLDILPDQPPEYIRALLTAQSYPFAGSPERVIEALFEGTTPTFEDLVAAEQVLSDQPGLALSSAPVEAEDEFLAYAKARKNVFDDQQMDLGQARLGKKQQDEATVLKDRAFIEEMKADILRRAEALSDSEEEYEPEATDDIDDLSRETAHVKVIGDGEESGDEVEEGDEQVVKQTPETACELAYIRDPALFNRDGNTRRSKAREDLRTVSGWDDNQLEGWAIMLERNPKEKEKLLQKHEFKGNQPGLQVEAGPSSNADRGRGRGGGRGGSRGRGRGGGGGDGDGDEARSRARNDKNKASRGNHNRKRGHDKKMARVAGPS